MTEKFLWDFMNHVFGKDWFKESWKNQKTTYSYMSATLSFNSDSSVEASLELPMLQELQNCLTGLQYKLFYYLFL